MAQLAERVLGKDEVAGPNPASSSKNPALACGIFIFSISAAKALKQSPASPLCAGGILSGFFRTR